MQQGGLVSYLAAMLDTVGVQVKVGSSLAPYLVQEMVQANRLHLLMSQLKEPVHFYCTETPVSRGWFVAFQRSISVAFHCTETPVSRCGFVAFHCNTLTDA